MAQQSGPAILGRSRAGANVHWTFANSHHAHARRPRAISLACCSVQNQSSQAAAGRPFLAGEVLAGFHGTESRPQEKLPNGIALLRAVFQQ